MSGAGAVPAAEFHYRLPARFGGHRPGAHAGTPLGAGGGFAAHRRLFDHPDPRRLDLRASLRDPHHEWLVRLPRQRVALAVQVVVDVSASMHFGGQRPKLAVVADFVEALGQSAFRAGDAVGLRAFDSQPRDDLWLPPRHGRGAGVAMAQRLRECRAPAPRRHGHGDGGSASVEALAGTLAPLAGRQGLVFLVSDFHWPLERLGALLAGLAPAWVVPMVVWDPAETEPPAAGGLMALTDAESGVRRSLWLREPLRAAWRDAVGARRRALKAVFDAQDLRPFELPGVFDGEALTRYFLECVA
ncbi:MAG TPA: VWA domain-containing protein [Ideonella sp.]|nr:VWA domain-containing protein [Ideonella sp.]